jgi:SMC interacting uncharacterized protein involved in chromosome segregation
MLYNLPEEPDHTCPLIDEVLDWMNDFDLVRKVFEDMSVQELNEVFDHYTYNISIMKNRMEEIRSANDALRQRSQYFEEEYERANSELEDRLVEIEALQSNTRELESQLEEKNAITAGSL